MEIFNLPEGLGQMQGLRALTLDNAPKLSTLPVSLTLLTSLEHLMVSDCESFSFLPEDGFGNLASLISHAKEPASAAQAARGYLSPGFAACAERGERLPLLVGSVVVAGAARVAGVAEVAVEGAVVEAAGVVEVVGVAVGVEAVGGVAAGPGAVEAAAAVVGEEAAAVVGEEAAAVAVEVGVGVDLGLGVLRLEVLLLETLRLETLGLESC
ncbi:unnamed protein product [Closterium sp. Yama58-4]|nr:unnamed protein product [Closterium sp. Yama58-4]